MRTGVRLANCAVPASRRPPQRASPDLTNLIVSRDADARLALAGAAVLAPHALVVGGAGALQVGELRAAAARARRLVEQLVVVAVEHVALAPARALVFLHLLIAEEGGGGQFIINLRLINICGESLRVI